MNLNAYLPKLMSTADRTRTRAGRHPGKPRVLQARIAPPAIAIEPLEPRIAPATVGGEIFLKGDYLEVGIHQAGSFGTAGDAPAGFHPLGGGGPTGRALGFVADPAKDGFTVGTPPQIGDYFLPGSPEEGWVLEWTSPTGGEKNFGNFGRMGVFQIPKTSLVETSTGTTQSAVWTGTATAGTEKVDVRQVVSFEKSALFFEMSMTLTNSGTGTLSSVEYMRNVDPDNEVPEGGSFVTSNYVAFQPGTLGNPDKAVVVAKGTTYGSTLQLGATDSRAVVSTEGFSNRDPDDILNSPVAPSQAAPIVADQAIALAFRFPSLAPGEAVTFSYKYFLNANQSPTISAANASAALTEDSASPNLTGAGTITFDDPDLSDAHTTSVVKTSGTLGGTLTASISDPATGAGPGTVDWNYSVPNSATQYLSAGQTTTEKFTVTVDDGGGGTTGQVVTATITGVNDVPVIGTPSLVTSTIQENQLASLSGSFTDPDLSDYHTVSINWGDGSAPTSVVLNPGVVNYSNITHQYLDDNPSVTTSDPYNITVSVSDSLTPGGATLSTSGTATTGITVTNAAPIVNPLSLNLPAISENGSVTVTGTFTDAGSQDTHTVMIDWGAGQVASAATVNAATKTFTATHQYLDDAPLGTSSDPYLITATVTDDDNGIGTASKTLTVNNLNPTANPDSGSTNEDSVLTVAASGVLGNDTDPAGANDPRTVTGFDAVSTLGATITVNADGSYSYDPHEAAQLQALAVGQTVNDTFTYTISDDDGGTAIGTVTIAVAGRDDAPELTVNDTHLYVENATPVVVAPHLTLTDIDGPNLTTATVSIGTNFNAAQDVLSFTPQGGITGSYNPSTGVLTLSGSASAADYQAALESVTYQNTSDDPTTGARSVQFSIGSSLFNPANGHYYEFVSGAGIRWDTAQAAAAGRSLFGLQGYLATITSAAENAFAASKLVGVGWIGGSDATSEGVWRWVTGPEAGQQFWQGLAGGGPVGGSYANWNGGEPNNSGNEDYAHMIANTNVGPIGSWNDLPIQGGGGDFLPQGYVVEYGGIAGDAVIQLSGAATVTIEAVNDAPAHTVPGAKTVNEDTNLAVTGLQVRDVDVHGATVQMNLGVDHGALTVRTDVAGGLTAAGVTGNGSGPVVLTGTVAQINATLAASNGLVYRGAANYSGSDTLTVTTNDQGNSGSGGAMSDTDTVGITVVPVADTPTLAVQSATGTEGTAIPLVIGSSLVDLDGSESLSIRISGVPAGAVLSAGTNLGSGAYALTPAQLSGLTLSVPDDATFSLTVTATATEGANGATASTSAQLGVTVANVAPVIDTLAANSVNENGAVHLTGSYHDIGALDTHTLSINWGEGAPQTVTVSGGTFDIVHQYLDDDPTGTNGDLYSIGVTLTDDNSGANSASTATTISNVAPTVLINQPAAISENGSATVSGSFTDVGSRDTHTVGITWGDANNAVGSTFSLAATNLLTTGQTFNSTTGDGAVLTIGAINPTTGVVSFTVGSHQYLDDGISGAQPGANATTSDLSTIAVTVTDDDLGVGSASKTVTVNNVTPTLSVSAGNVLENGTTTLSGTITDIGRLDTHDVDVAWADTNDTAASHFDLRAIYSVNTANGALTQQLFVGNTFSSTNANDPGTVLTITGVNTTTGAIAFTVDHQYLDDGVSGAQPGLNNTASDVSAIKVKLTDDDALAGNRKIAVFGGTDGTSSSGAGNVANDLIALGVFDSVTVLNGSESLATLQNYGAVLIYTNGTGSFSTFGNTLADYIDAGGHVAAATFAYQSQPGGTDWGRLETGGYFPFVGYLGNYSNGTLGTFDASHPIMSSPTTITSIGGYYRDLVNLSADAQLVASWSDGRPLVAIDGGSGVVGITLFPNDVYGNLSGQYMQLFGNSLSFLSGGTAVEATASITVNNVAPTLNVLAPDILENETTTLSGTITDIGRLDTHDVDVTWDDANDTAASHFDLRAIYSVNAANGALTQQLFAGNTFASTNASDPGTVLTVTGVNTTTGAITFTVDHQYFDDGIAGAQPGQNNTASDVSTINVTVRDDDAGTVVATDTVRTSNVAPTLSVSAPDISEHGTTTLSGTITDIGRLDTHDVNVAWADPNATANAHFDLRAIYSANTTTGALTQQLLVGATFNSTTDSSVLTVTGVNTATGAISFTTAHQYADDGAALGNNTSSDDSSISVTVSDDDAGAATASTVVKVSNVAPTVSLQSVSAINENGVATVTGSFSDIGLRDAHSLVVNWGDANNGAASTFALGATATLATGATLSSTDGATLTVTAIDQTTGTVSYSVSHQYVDDGSALGNGTASDDSTIGVTVSDDDSGSGSASEVVTVSNVAPTVSLQSVSAINENGVATVTGSFSDIGLRDAHSLVVNWGDANNGAASTFALGATATLATGATLSSTDGATLTVTAIDQTTGTVSYSVSHQYVDDGSALGNGTASDDSTIGVTVSDDDSGSGSASEVVTVSNVAPTVSLQSVSAINENGVATVTGSFSDIGLRDAHSLVVNWGDANNGAASTFVLGATATLATGATLSSTDGATLTVTAIDQTTGTVSYSVSHQYVDDGAAVGNGTASDDSTIGVTVSDDDSGTGTASEVVTVSNVAPVIAPLTLSTTTIDENGSVTVTGSFTDVGSLDTHTVMIDWGNGETASAATVDPVHRTFTATHQYLDDQPTGTVADTYTIKATVTDDDTLSDSASTTLLVKDVTAVVAPLTLSTTTIDENGSVTVTGSFTDVGSLDTHTVMIDWGNGETASAATVDPVHRTFIATHQYLDDQPTGTASDTYTIKATVTDDDTLSTSVSTTLLVKDVAAVVAPLTLSATTINENGSVTVTGSFTDVGSLDTHTVLIDWGNGETASAATVDPVHRTFTATHQYLDDRPTATAADTYTIKATVTDDDALSTSVSTTLLVKDVAAVVAPLTLSSTTVNENGSVTVTGSFTDVGSLDTHSVLIDWGSGETASAATVDQVHRTFTATHQYLDDRPTATATDTYTIKATVTDDDTLAGTASAALNVANLAPVIVSNSIVITAPECSDTHPGDVVKLSANFTDVGTLDTHTVIIDWGDGTTSNSSTTPGNFTVLNVAGGGTGGFTATHQYTTGGVFNVTFKVVDDDTGLAAAGTQSWVTGVRVDPTTGQLQIIGSNGRDHVVVNYGGTDGGTDGGLDANDGKVHVHAQFNLPSGGTDGGADIRFNSADVKSVFIHLCDGDDKAHVSNNLLVPATLIGDGGKDDLDGGGGDDFIDGGSGDDKISGGSGHDVLLGGLGNDDIKGDAGNDALSGGDGNDKLQGGKGRDVLIGGKGIDDLKGGSDGGDDNMGDILVGGLTTQDANVAALRSIVSVWSTGNNYSAMVAQLTGSGGLLQVGSKVFDDQAKDVLSGGNKSLDLFFADLDGLHGDDDTVKGSTGDTIAALAQIISA